MIADLWHDVIAPLLKVIAAWCLTATTITALYAWHLWQDPENRPTPPDSEEEPMTNTPTTATSWITRTGVVRIDQQYRDAVREEPRTLRVKTITARDGRDGRDPKPLADVTCSVTRVRDGEVEQMRDTTLTADRLTSRAFVLVEGDE